MTDKTHLKRSLSLPVLFFYGLGTIVGAGIYVLIGEVVAVSGTSTTYAFLLAGIIAAFTGCSYAELSSRFPLSAGAALYVQQAWKRKKLSQVVGYMTILTSIVSAATLTNGFVGYLQVFIDLPSFVIITALVVLLTFIAAWGIKESALLITAITLLEVGGLAFILFMTQPDVAVTSWENTLHFPTTNFQMAGIFMGSFLAFYAFIGFEDMVNVVEEVKTPRRNMPLAILLCIATATLLYIAVAVVAIRSVTPQELAQSAAPLAVLVTKAGYSPIWISLISLVAVINGALVQLIMASRVLYGMARQKMAPPLLGYVHTYTKTPVIGTLFTAGGILLFALWLPLGTLAQITSFIMLCLFFLVNLALVFVKRRTPKVADAFILPQWMPVIGAFLCLVLLGAQVW